MLLDNYYILGKIHLDRTRYKLHLEFVHIQIRRKLLKLE